MELPYPPTSSWIFVRRKNGRLWVFLVVPLAGALIAGFSWKVLFGRAK